MKFRTLCIYQLVVSLLLLSSQLHEIVLAIIRVFIAKTCFSLCGYHLVLRFAKSLRLIGSPPSVLVACLRNCLCVYLALLYQGYLRGLRLRRRLLTLTILVLFNIGKRLLLGFFLHLVHGLSEVSLLVMVSTKDLRLSLIIR